MFEIDGVHAALASALTKRGYESLTPVQEAVLDEDLIGRDLLVSAQTGSGKTVAFGLAFAPNLLGQNDKFDRADTPLALVVAPTRELALQVQRELEWLFAPTHAIIRSCVGGMDMRKERRALAQGAHIVVGTPGRLRDHIDRGALKLGNIKTVVLDEADEMLDLGFRDDLEYILETTPEDRRTLMFSATVPRPILNLAKRYQNNAVRISTTAEQKQHLDIEYRALLVSHRDVENGIINVLRYYDAKNTIVFCATRAAVARMTSRFSNRGFSVVALSGELSQEQRSHALQAMRDGRARICIATDVAARGIDLPDLELVIHADLPNNKETLLHRSGRTGRAGRKGVSAVIVAGNLKGRAERLLRAANVNAEWAKPPSADEILARDDERILADSALSEPLDEAESDFVNHLLSQYSAEQVAAAFVRGHRQSKSAPEELMEVSVSPRSSRRDRDERNRSDDDRGPRKIADFEDGKWISLSIGRNQKAEPRWLLPMLCKASKLTKRNIGSIKIRNDETFVEIANDSFDAFISAIGPNQVLEKSIRVTPVDGMPDFDREQTRRDRGPKRSASPNRTNERTRKRGEKHSDGEKTWERPKRNARGEYDRKSSRKNARQENRENRDKALKELSYTADHAEQSRGNKPKARTQTKSRDADTSRDKINSKKTYDEKPPVKKPKKSKKNKTVKFAGLKKKGTRGNRSGGSASEEGGNAPRRRPSKPSA